MVSISDFEEEEISLEIEWRQNGEVYGTARFVSNFRGQLSSGNLEGSKLNILMILSN